MSIDDSITILQSQGVDGRPEYRVAHVLAGIPLTWDEMARLCDEDLSMNVRCVRNQFAGCEIHRNRSDAVSQAQRLFEECSNSSPWGEPENGICEVDIGIRFPTASSEVVLAAPTKIPRGVEIARLEARLLTAESLTASREGGKDRR